MTMAMMEEKFNALNQTVEVMKISSKLQAGSITNLQNQRSDDLKEICRLTRITAALSEKNKNKE
jgi:23S rRNA maturation mini-RNase III